MQTLPLHQIDAFASHVFAGNPAAVVPLASWLPDDVMQAIAAENNLAETAFVVPTETPMRLRWFTPTLEIDLCGHATLATAFVLFAAQFAGHSELEFDTRSGRLRVLRDGPQLTLDFPARPGVAVPVTAAMQQALGVEPREAYQARDLMVVLESEAQVRALDPDMARVSALSDFAVIVTAPGRDADFVSRFFAPRAGIPEDPVTGSAHCTLAPYWAERLGKSTLAARQVSPRGGDLACAIRGDRVFISGQCVEYLRGEITVP